MPPNYHSPQLGLASRFFHAFIIQQDEQVKSWVKDDIRCASPNLGYRSKSTVYDGNCWLQWLPIFPPAAMVRAMRISNHEGYLLDHPFRIFLPCHSRARTARDNGGRSQAGFDWLTGVNGVARSKYRDPSGGWMACAIDNKGNKNRHADESAGHPPHETPKEHCEYYRKG